MGVKRRQGRVGWGRGEGGGSGEEEEERRGWRR